MSSLSWRLKRLKAMGPREVVFRISQAKRVRREYSRPTSPLAEGARRLLAELARPTATHPIKFFDYSYPFPEIFPDWHKDPESSVIAPKVPWPEIDYKDKQLVGSAKNIWEMNRHQFLESWEDAEAISAIILDWISANPRPIGINWASSLEPAFRVISWQRALETLGDHIDHRIAEVIRQSVSEQCDHIRTFPSLFSSANNHRIGELTGELAGACILQKPSWTSEAYKSLCEEADLQVTKDGVDKEQAIFYHRYVLGFFERAIRYCEILGLDPRTLQEKIKSMLQFLSAMTVEPGVWFEIGDRDDGIPTIASEPECGKGTYFFDDGGYAIYKESDIAACFRAGPFGYPSIAAHAHCDQLSVTLFVRGSEILADSGTYCYHENEEMRKYFKGTSAHNTIKVDGLDQAEYGGQFLWSSHADGEISQVSETAFEGSHQGYLRLQDEVLHRRKVDFGSEHLVSITDRLDAKREHDYEVFWNLGPNCSVSNVDGRSVDIGCEGQRFRLEFSADAEFHVSIGEGRYSRKFGEMVTIPRVEVRAHAQNWSITTHVEQI